MLPKVVAQTLFGFVLAVSFGCLPGCGDDDSNGTADSGPGDAADDAGSPAEELVGTWTGHEVGQSSPEWSFTFSATTAVVTMSGVEAYQGTYTIGATTTPRRVTIAITSSAYPAYIGKTANGIYKIEGTTLTFAGNEPGSSAVPTSFTPDGTTRVFTLTRK